MSDFKQIKRSKAAMDAKKSMAGGPGDGDMTSEQKKDMYSPFRSDPRNESLADANVNRTPAGQAAKWLIDKAVGGLPQEPNRHGKGDRENSPDSPMRRYNNAAAKSKNIFRKEE